VQRLSSLTMIEDTNVSDQLNKPDWGELLTNYEIQVRAYWYVSMAARSFPIIHGDARKVLPCMTVDVALQTLSILRHSQFSPLLRLLSDELNSQLISGEL
jgi:hypothetical protein